MAVLSLKQNLINVEIVLGVTDEATINSAALELGFKIICMGNS